MKRLVGRLLLIACSALSLFTILGIQVPHARAVGGTAVTITSPQVNGKATGHVGTKVQIDGTGFNPGTINLYTTTSSDTTKCTNSGDPASLGLTVFSSSPTVVAGQDGTFSLQTTWPDSAGSGGTSYYICAAASGPSALSVNTFIVAPPVQITVMPSTVPQGGKVTVTGSNWLPPQTLNVAIVVGNSSAPPLVTQTISSDNNGSFTVSLTIPSNANTGVYSVSVNAQNEPTSAMTIVQNDSLTVTLASTPTPTPTATAVPSPTTTATTVASTGTTQTGNTGGASTNSGSISPTLLLALGSLGVLLIIVGIILFVVYAKQV